MSDTNSYVIENVDALYPRINQTYKFDTTAGKSVPCAPETENAAYSMKFRMNKTQATQLYHAMNESWTTCDRRKKDWPEKLTPNCFERDEEDKEVFIGKVSLNGAYNNKLTTPPKQFDSKNNLLPADFLLTTGSTVNINVTFYPYGPNPQKPEGGVALHIRAVQVIKYVPMALRSPFEEVADGYTSNGDSSPTETTAEELFPDKPTEDTLPDNPEPSSLEVNEDVFDEPKVKKSKATTPPPKKDDDLGALLDEFDD